MLTRFAVNRSIEKPAATRAVAASVFACAVAVVSAPAPSDARVTRIVIDQQLPEGQPFPEVGQYERLNGRAFGELDPHDRRNTIIQDIELAPRNAHGRIEYVATF